MRARYTVPALSLLHLLLFLISRRWGGWGGWSAHWTASAFAVLAVLLFRDLLTSRRRDRLPDVPATLAWGAAGLLELHILVPAVADSRIVPAVLFPSIAFLLRAGEAAVYAAAAFTWMVLSPAGAWPSASLLAEIGGMGGAGFAAGRAVRRKLAGSRSGTEMVRDAIEESRSLVLPWESSGAAADKELAAEEVERMGLLRSRGELLDGIRRILEGVLPVSGADRIVYVYAASGRGRSFRAGAAAGGGVDPGGEELSIPDDSVPVREAILFRRAYYSDGDEAVNPGIGRGGFGEDGPVGVAATPVSVEGNVEGAILALRFGKGTWNEPVRQALEMAAFLAAREIEGARKRYRAHRYLARQEGFHGLIRKIAEVSEKGESGSRESLSPRRKVYQAAAEQARRHLDAARTLLVEADERGKRGRIAWQSGGRDPGEREERVSLEGTYIQWVLRQRVHRIVSGDRAAAARFSVLPAAWGDSPAGSCLLVPVSDMGGYCGVLVCESDEGRSFDAQDAEAAKDILSVMRMGISHALRLENLEKEARYDGLTGLLNRKTFCAQLGNVLSRLDGRYPCAVIMLDIDHFKKVNDTYGHPAGDDVLRKVSSVIRKTVRKVDMAGRYGGEEFAIYLHGTDQTHASQVAERLRLMIRKTRFVFAGRELAVTASLGIASYPAHGRTWEELIRHADSALYASKQGGRDRTTIYIKQ